jgi:hypothetical protein
MIPTNAELEAEQDALDEKWGVGDDDLVSLTSMAGPGASSDSASSDETVSSTKRKAGLAAVALAGGYLLMR